MDLLSDIHGSPPILLVQPFLSLSNTEMGPTAETLQAPSR